MRNEERGRPPKQFKDTEFQELLDDNYWIVNTKRYQQQLIDLNRALREKRPEYQKRQHKVIFLHDNAPSHKAKTVQDTLEALN